MLRARRFPVLAAAALVCVFQSGAAHSQHRERSAYPAGPPATGKAGGPDCSAPTVFTVSPGNPYQDTGNTCGANADVTEYANATCLTFPYPGPELIYQIELFAGNDIEVVLTPNPLADMGIFMVSDCTTPASCVDFHDAIGPGAVSTIPRLQSGPYSPGVYFLYVDSYYATGSASCGDYTLDASGMIPVELLRFSVD